MITLNGKPATPEEEQQMERDAYFREQNIKALYCQLYQLGLSGKKDKVRNKLRLLSEFFGNLGSVSDLSNKEISLISHFLDYLKADNFKFEL